MCITTNRLDEIFRDVEHTQLFTFSGQPDRNRRDPIIGQAQYLEILERLNVFDARDPIG